MRRFRWVVAALVALCVAGAAFAAPADLDTTFSTDGLFTKAPQAGGTSANDVLVQPDGTLAVVGAFGSQNDWLVALIAADGSQEISSVRVDFGGIDEARAVARQADGKLVAVGESGSRLAVARVATSPALALDASFDGDGKALLPVSLSAGQDVLVQPDGKIVLVGRGTNVASGELAVVRLNPDGSLDPSFDGDGIALVDLGALDSGNAVALQADGKIVAGGTGSNLLGDSEMLVARLNPDGSPDPTFDTDGKASFDVGGGGVVNAIVVQPDGTLLLAGVGFHRGAVLHLNADGSLDTAYAIDGRLTVQLGGQEQVLDAALTPSGKLVLAARSTVVQGLLLVQATPDGTLDASFDTDGVKAIPFGASDAAEAVAVQANGAIVVAGRTGTGDAKVVAVARVVGEPPPPPAPPPPPPPAPPPPPPAPSGPRCNGQVATIVGTAGVDRLKGTPGDDVIVALGGNDVIDAKGGDDLVCAGGGADVVKGGSGDDTLLGQAGKDDLRGGVGSDLLTGGAGADTLRGGGGEDGCTGGPGRDAGLGCEAGTP